MLAQKLSKSVFVGEIDPMDEGLHCNDFVANCFLSSNKNHWNDPTESKRKNSIKPVSGVNAIKIVLVIHGYTFIISTVLERVGVFY